MEPALIFPQTNKNPNNSLLFFSPEEEARRPGQRPTTAMMGNEVLNKEQLYDLFQQILGVKKFEHQLLYNAMQVGGSNASERKSFRILDATALVVISFPARV